MEGYTTSSAAGGGTQPTRGAVRRPVPIPDALTSEFWQAARQGRLVIQRCGSCARFQHPPEPLCMTCGSTELKFEPVSGRARLVAWTTTHHGVLAGLAGELPYVCMVVEIEEQRDLWLVCDRIGHRVDATRLRRGMPMRAVFDTVVGAFVLPQFVAAEEGRGQ